MLDLWKSKFPKFHRNLRRPDTKNEQPITRRFKASYPQDQPTFQISQFTLLLFSKKQKEKPKKKKEEIPFSRSLACEFNEPTESHRIERA